MSVFYNMNHKPNQITSFSVYPAKYAYLIIAALSVPARFEISRKLVLG